jgi:hypothetical protein
MNLVKASVAAGIVVGLLSGLPFVQFGNCLCCLWVVAGGVLGSFLFRSFSGDGTGPRRGLVIGAAAGALGAVVKTVLDVALLALGLSAGQMLAPKIIAMIPPEFYEERWSKMPPEMAARERAQVEDIRAGKVPTKMDPAQIATQAVVSLFMFALFGGAGGLIGGLLVPAVGSRPTEPATAATT